MKNTITIISAIIAILFIQCNQRQKPKSSSKSSSNEVPVATAHAWQDSLSNSQFTIYQNFDGQYLFLSDVEKKIRQTNQYMRLFLGKSGDDYRLISAVCQGTLTSGNFNNDYNTLEYFDGSGWTQTVYDSLEVWLDSFKYALPSTTEVTPYAMVIPNENFSGLKPYVQNDKIYISFGLNGNDIELLMGNEDNTKSNAKSANEKYWDNLIKCPDVCGGNDPS